MTDFVRDAFHRPLHDLRISVTDKCNFRCPYCMPIDTFGENYQFLPKAQVLTVPEIERLARLFVRCALRTSEGTGGTGGARGAEGTGGTGGCTPG